MRTVELTDRVDLQELTSRPGIYVARADTPAYGDLTGFVVAGEVAELGQAMSPDGVHMLAVQTGPTANPAITIGAEFFAGAKADYANWREKWWREAIQNAVDAGAKNIVCTVDEFDDRVRVTCSDDGSGMDEETLINKFLVLGRSGKGSAPGSVGGFGKAKELLLLPWISWAVQTKKDGSPGVLVEGHGIQYDVREMHDTRGTTISVEMAKDDCTAAVNAITFIKKCHLPNVRFSVNGEAVKANLKAGELVRTMDDDASVYYDPKVKTDYAMMFVRVNGMFMYEEYISSSIKGVVVVELLGKSTELLTANRDGIGKRDLRYALQTFTSELAANSKTALRKKKNVLRERFHGEGKFAIRPELVQRDILVAVGDLTPAGAGGTLSADQQADVKRVVEAVGAVANETEGAQIDLRVPRDAIQAMMEIKFLGPLHVRTLARRAAWQPDFFIYNEVEEFKVPSKFRPDKMPPTLRKLARFWAELCRFVLIQLNYEGEYGVGWIFETDAAAAHLRLEDDEWLLLNPFVNGEMKSRYGEKLGTGEIWSLSNKKHIDWLYALAVHEATHLADGIKMHDEIFASAFTQNVAKTANRGKLIERIRKAVVARGTLPGAGIERIGNPCGCKHNPCPHVNPPPEGSRYWPTEAVDADDLAPMTFLNALRTLIEYMDANPDEILADMNVGVDRPELTVIRIRRHRTAAGQGMSGRLVMEIQKPDLLPEFDRLDVWQLAHDGAPSRQNLVAVVPSGVPAPGELSIDETRRRLARRSREAGNRCWDIFDTGRALEIEIDDECFSGMRDEDRVWDNDVAQLPEAQRELRDAEQANLIARGGDVADVIDQMLEERRQARAAVVAALDLRPDANPGFLDEVVNYLNFTVEFRRPHEGERVWEVDEETLPENARDEIWRESEEFGWRAAHDTGHASRGMEYAVITPDSREEPEAIRYERGDLGYLVNKWLSDPEKFRQFADKAARRVADSVTDTPNGPTFQWGEHRIASRPSGSDETLARIYIHNAMSMRGSALMTPAQNNLAHDMISRVAARMYAHEAGRPNWAAIISDHERQSTRQFERYVLECAGDVGLRALDEQRQPYSLQRPPAFWTYGSFTEIVPIDYVRPDELHEIEQAVANALELNMDIYPNEQRDFIAAVWEEILRRRRTGIIHSLPSRVDEAEAFGAHIREAARAIAREALEDPRGSRFWHWNALDLPMIDRNRPAYQQGRIISGSQIVPGMRGRSPEPELRMTWTSGGRGQYPGDVFTYVTGFADSSYGNDVYDSLEFVIRDTVYRLWVAPQGRRERENENDPRYQLQVVEPPHEGASIRETREDGQPTGDIIFETESPQELVQWIRDFASNEPRATYQEPRPRHAGRNTTGLSEVYLDDYLRVLDAMDQLDNIGAPDDDDYIRILKGTATLATERMNRPRFTPRIDALLLTDPQFEDIRVAINRLWDRALERGDEDSPDYYEPLRRIATEATRRATLVESGRTPPKKVPDISDVRGQTEAVQALERAVGEKQNVLLVGDLGTADKLAELTTTLFPGGSAPFAMHGAGLRGDLAGDVQRARKGVLHIHGFDDFNPDHLRELARALKAIPREERPLVVASAKSYPLPRRVIDIIDLPLRATLTVGKERDPKGESSATIRGRIAAAAGAEPEDLTKARFEKLELEPTATPSPVARSKRIASELAVGDRVHVVSAIIRPPDLYVPRGNAGEVTINDQHLGGRIEVLFDDGTKVVWTGSDFEKLGYEIEAEPDVAQRYRMIEMNPKNTLLKENPGWVTRLLARHFEKLQKDLPPQYMPKLDDVRPRYSKMVSDFSEYGCGAYGCVYPTHDPKIVLKVTTDDTEAQFANELSEHLPKQVTVKYHLVAKLPEEHKGRPVWLLWRDSADHVGEIIKVAGGKGKKAHVVEDAIADQHTAAQKAFLAVIKIADPDGAKMLAKSMAQSKKFKAKEIKAIMSGDYKKYVNEWADSLHEMGKKVPELQELAAGMVADLKSKGVLFGDVHDGNLGRINGRWLIIDPGNVSVIQPEA